MKTPEEIKEGLKKCLSGVDCFKNCPYAYNVEEGKVCGEFLRDDSLEYIDNLEERVAIMTERPIAHWVDNEDGTLVTYDSDGDVNITRFGVHCSNCGDSLIGSNNDFCRGRFCPSCGAEMINKE